MIAPPELTGEVEEAFALTVATHHELLAEALEFRFEFGDAAITLLTAGTSGTRRSHEVFPKIG